MHWSILARYLMALLVITFASEINGEIRVKRDLQVITDILKTKLDTIRNLSRTVVSNPLPPVVINKPTIDSEIVETHAHFGSQGIVTPLAVPLAEPCKNEPIQVPSQEIKPLSNKGNYYYKQIRDDGSAMIYTSNANGEVDVTDTRYTVPKDELKPMPYRTKFLYSQFQNGGDNSGVVYTLDSRGEVQVSHIRDIPLNTGNNVVQKSAYAYQSDVRPIVTPYQSYSQYERPIRPIYRPLVQNANVIPDYSYKMLHRDGSVTTYLGTGDVSHQQLRPMGMDNSRPIPNPPAYVVNRIQNVAANTLCIDRPSNVLCKLNPVWFSYENTVPDMQVGILPIAAPVRYTYGENIGYNTMSSAEEVKEVPKDYIYVPSSSAYDAPQPVSSNYNQSEVRQEERTQMPIDDIKVSVNNNNAPAKTVGSTSQGSTYMYKQVSADGSDMTVHGDGKDSVPINFNEAPSRIHRLDRGDIPQGRSF